MAKKLLIVSQVFVPDPAAVGQYLLEAAEAMVERGWEVEVLAADRSYDDRNHKFAKREVLGSILVRRLPFSSSGKNSIVRRLLGQLSFCGQAVVHGMTRGRLDAVLVTTSPPMGGVVGWAVGLLRRIPVKYWVMDINPDQAVVIGAVGKRSLMVRLLEWGNRRILARASDVICLDRHMEKTIRRKQAKTMARIHILPPWPMEGYLQRIEHADNPFRQAYGLDGKFVFMYSGNHSVVHPLTTFLRAASSLRDRDDLVFVFIGGGVGKVEVERVIAAEELSNVISLPYQPLDQIKYSLSAADVHLVSMGKDMVGIVHPCKFYAALALSKPILFLGPMESHVFDVIREYQCGWQVDHGEVDRARELIEMVSNLPADELRARGDAGRDATERALSKQVLVGNFCDVVER